MLSTAAQFTCEPFYWWELTSFLTIVLSAECLQSPALYWYCSLLLPVSSCHILTHYPWTSESARRVSRNTNIHKYDLRRNSALFLLVHVHVRLLYLRSSWFTTFYASLNSRNNLRETLDGPELVLVTFTQLEAHPPPGTTVPCSQVMTETRTNIVFSERTVHVPSFVSSLDSPSVITLDREKYPVPAAPAALAG